MSADIQELASPDQPSSPPTSNPSSPPPLRPGLQPPQRKISNPFTSTFHYITDPLSYTVSSLARRLSEDEAPTPLARALSANYNGSMMDSMNSVFHPPRRHPSPFQPPPLTPLSLRGQRESKGALLSTALAEEVRLLVPARLQLCDHWDLVYSLSQHGSTLRTLYSLTEQYRGKRGGFVIVVRDANGGLFGAYLNEHPRPAAHYFGNGECFLWRAQQLPGLPDLSNLPPPPSEDTTHAQRMTTIGSLRVNGSHTPSRSGTSTPSERIRFKAFPYTGENDFSIFCQPEYLSVGGGDGHYGLWLDDNLRKGVSQQCLTFGNEGLSEEGPKFEVLGVEVWFIGS